MTDDRFSLPEFGADPEDLERALDAFQGDDIRSHWIRCFRPPADVQEVARKAYMRFLSDNGLFAGSNAAMRRVEGEVADMCLGLVNAPAGAWATLTSGGSESIYSALHAMREWAREHRPGATDPEVVASRSTHPAFSRACHYFNLKIVRAPLGDDLRPEAAAMERLIGPNTIGIVGSAPCFPYGLYDPIADLSDLALRHDIWLHVDACVGGYLAPFVERLGRKLPPWDFRVPGVRSISADLHKLGYCPKSISTILWRNPEDRVHHLVQPDDWVGGKYSAVTMLGSRSMGPVYAAWAVMHYLGVDGYLRLAQQLLDACDRLGAGIAAIDGLYVLENDLLPLAFGARDLDLRQVLGGMAAKGWSLLACAEPPLIQLPVDPATDETVISTFLADLRDVCAQVRAGGQTEAAELKY